MNKCHNKSDGKFCSGSSDFTPAQRKKAVAGITRDIAGMKATKRQITKDIASRKKAGELVPDYFGTRRKDLTNEIRRYENRLSSLTTEPRGITRNEGAALIKNLRALARRRKGK